MAESQYCQNRQMGIVCAWDCYSLVHITRCCFWYQVRGYPCQRNFKIEAANIPHWKMEKVESIGRNDGTLCSNWWGENENWIIKQEMHCVCLREAVVELELQSNCTCFADKKITAQPKRKMLSNIFKLQYFKTKLFFVFAFFYCFKTQGQFCKIV